MSVSLLPQIAGAFLPPASPAAGLTDDERQLVLGLSTKLAMLSPQMLMTNSYYEGTQRLANLGVSIPPQLAGLRTVVDWPRICVDPLVQRCVVDSLRLPGQLDPDPDLADFWLANDLDSELPLCFLDSLVYGRGFVIVGSPDNPGDPPIVTVESPLNVTVTWDPRTKQVTAAYQSYEAEGVFVAVLYLPDVTVSMSRAGSAGVWQVDNRDEHNFGEVPVVRFPNRERAAEREGRSEISPAIRNTTDSAVRSLLGMEIAREFYSVPHRYILGASESDYRDAEGNPKAALDMVMSKFLAFERDAEGNAPSVGQFSAFDPSVFTKIIDEHAQLMASYTQFPPAYFGLVSQANPASADAIRAAQDGMDRRGRQVQAQFSRPMRKVAGLMWRIANDGAPLPAEYNLVNVDWADVATPTPAATTDALFKQASMGAVAPTSDTVLAKMGYTAIERARLAIDRQRDAAAQVLAELASSLQIREARAATMTAHDLGQKPPNQPNAEPTPPADGSPGPGH